MNGYKLMLKITNGGWLNLYKWVEKIHNEYYGEKALEERACQ